MKLPIELLILITKHLIVNIELASYYKITQIMNWKVNKIFFQLAIIYFRHGCYKCSLEDFLLSTGIDDGVYPKFLKENINRRIYKTIFAYDFFNDNIPFNAMIQHIIPWDDNLEYNCNLLEPNIQSRHFKHEGYYWKAIKHEFLQEMKKDTESVLSIRLLTFNKLFEDCIQAYKSGLKEAMRRLLKVSLI